MLEWLILGVTAVVLALFALVAIGVNRNFQEALRTLAVGQRVHATDSDGVVKPYRVAQVNRDSWVGERIWSPQPKENGETKTFTFEQIFSIAQKEQIKTTRQ